MSNPFAVTVFYEQPDAGSFGNPTFFNKINNTLNESRNSTVGINGGFSVTNKSNQPVAIVGNNLITSDAGAFSSEVDDVGDNVSLTLEPGQQFVPTYRTWTDGKTTFEQFDGNVVDIASRTVVKKDVGIYDVDGIDIQGDQTFEDNNGKFRTNFNTLNIPFRGEEIKLGSPMVDGFYQNKLGGDPDPTDIGEGNLDIINTKAGHLKLKATGSWENRPNIKFGDLRQ